MSDTFPYEYPGTLKVWDPMDPTKNTWVPIGGAGSAGEQGPAGPPGPTGPENVLDTASEEVVAFGVDPPDPVLYPNAELWFDPDEPYPTDPADLPPGGSVDQALVRADATTYAWSGPFIPLDGGGSVPTLTVDDLAVTGTLATPTVAGDVLFDSGISAASVVDRTVDYTWEQLDVDLLLNAGWYSDLTIGPCKAWRNRYGVVLNLCLRKDVLYTVDWFDVVTLPVEWRSSYDLWDSWMSVETLGSSALFDLRLRAGVLSVKESAGTLDWQIHTRIPVYFNYPRPN